VGERRAVWCCPGEAGSPQRGTAHRPPRSGPTTSARASMSCGARWCWMQIESRRDLSFSFFFTSFTTKLLHGRVPRLQAACPGAGAGRSLIFYARIEK
jgi:hypothetical protein